MVISRLCGLEGITYADLGIAKFFPVEPKMSKGTYGEDIRLPLSKVVPDTILTAMDGGVTYKVTVVDFKGREADGANILAESFSRLASRGTVVSQGFPRLDLGTNSVYGRFHLQGYGFDEKIGHDFPIGDNDPGDRDLGYNRPAPPKPN
jgi:hypothetical protein